MKRLFCALILAISIHAVFLSIQINMTPKPGIQTKTEPIKITMSHRQIKKQVMDTPVTSNSTLKKQKPEALEPVRKKPLKQHKIVQNKIKKVKTIKLPDPKTEPEIEPEIDTKPLPKQNNVLANLPSPPNLPMEPKLTTAPAAVTNYEKKSTLLPHQYKPATAVISTKAIPKYKTNPKLGYPRIAKKRGYQGQVLLFVVVSKKGITKEVSISKSSGHKILDTAALKAVKKWQFYPGTKDGNPVEMSVTVPIRFDLK